MIDWLAPNVFLSFETPAYANPCSTRALLPRPSIVDQTSPTRPEPDRLVSIAPNSQCYCFPLHSLAACAVFHRSFFFLSATTSGRLYILSAFSAALSIYCLVQFLLLNAIKRAYLRL
ncbi:hypothetical protein P3342_002291 [Pyrenophora teres f. teres]|nr:hypothetical protein P3342_002291 [Pyrenophora teres f. teres]